MASFFKEPRAIQLLTIFEIGLGLFLVFFHILDYVILNFKTDPTYARGMSILLVVMPMASLAIGLIAGGLFLTRTYLLGVLVSCLALSGLICYTGLDLVSFAQSYDSYQLTDYPGLIISVVLGIISFSSIIYLLRRKT